MNTSIESNASEKGQTFSISDSDDDGLIYIDANKIYSSSNIHSSKTYFYSFSHMGEANLSSWLSLGHYYNVKLFAYCYGSGNNYSNSSCDVYFVAGDYKALLCSKGIDYATRGSFNFKYDGGEVGLLFDYSVVNKSSGTGYFYPTVKLRSDWVETQGNLVLFKDIGTTSNEEDILLRIDETTIHTDQTMDEVNDTTKGIWGTIKDFFGSFFDNLINSIIHVIVPTSEEMSDLFNRLNDFFAETFGFLYYPFDFIIDAFNIFLEADSETGLTFPSFSIMGHEVWPDMTYDLTSEPIVNTIFGYVRMGTGAMLAMWFVNYLRNFFDKRFGGGGS